jgi:hypothetical protein
MKAKLIVDSLSGLNPDYNPPVRSMFQTDDEYHDAKALYNVPPQHIIPAGTELTGEFCWVHCYPDSEVGFRHNPRTGARTPTRTGRGMVRAVPLDAGCEAALLKHVQQAAKIRRMTVEAVQKEIAEGVAESLKTQIENDKANAAMAALIEQDAARTAAAIS